MKKGKKERLEARICNVLGEINSDLRARVRRTRIKRFQVKLKFVTSTEQDIRRAKIYERADVPTGGETTCRILK